MHLTKKKQIQKNNIFNNDILPILKHKLYLCNIITKITTYAHITSHHITSGQFTGREAHVPFDYPAGLYYIKYINAHGEDSFTKFIKK